MYNNIQFFFHLFHEYLYYYVLLLSKSVNLSDFVKFVLDFVDMYVLLKNILAILSIDLFIAFKDLNCMCNTINELQQMKQHYRNI